MSSLWSDESNETNMLLAHEKLPNPIYRGEDLYLTTAYSELNRGQRIDKSNLSSLLNCY